MAKTKGFLVDVPVTLTVCVRGTDNEEAAHNTQGTSSDRLSGWRTTTTAKATRQATV